MTMEGGGNWRWTCRMHDPYQIANSLEQVPTSLKAFETVTQLLRTLEQVLKFLRIVNVHKYLNINNLGVAILISSPP